MYGPTPFVVSRPPFRNAGFKYTVACTSEFSNGMNNYGITVYNIYVR